LITTSLGNQNEDKGIYVPDKKEDNSTVDKYEYIMHGKIYKMEPKFSKKHNVNRMRIFASFGGLLMKITGSEDALKKFDNENRIFLLLLKT
jgi:DNA-directed RNA polymerase I, II, and III subunit RPABC3